MCFEKLGVGEYAYFYCCYCGVEYVAENVSSVCYSRETSDGEYGLCPSCGEESQVDYDDKG